MRPEVGLLWLRNGCGDWPSKAANRGVTEVTGAAPPPPKGQKGRLVLVQEVCCERFINR